MKAKNVVQPVAVDPRTAVYHLKVYILNISPMIYRRFMVDGNTHIAELHHLIQMMMGWENQHLHVFHIWGVDYGIAYDDGGYYREQLTAEGCKRLIANSINCWNLLHLSESLAECKKQVDREELLKNILATSTHSWEHINMLGEYDFSEKVEFQTFNLDEIFKDGAEI